MTSRALAVASLVVLVGCSRTFSPARALAPQPIGTRCGGDGGVLCASGICADGVCCERACGATERCDVPGRAGSCSARALGDSCDAGAACPSGFCTSGVCCESACTGSCQQCDVQLSRGTCTVVPDNTDPHRSCAGACSVCFSGQCTPVDPGTDPRRECGAGTACGFDATCRKLDGAPCASASECAARSCVLGTCALIAQERVTEGLNPNASVPNLADYPIPRVVEDLAASAGGQVAVAVTEVEIHKVPTRAADVIEAAVLLLTQAPNKSWTSRLLLGSFNVASQERPRVALRYLGETLQVVISRPPDSACGQGQPRCGLMTFALAADGATSAEAVLDPLAQGVDGLSMSADAQGRPVLGTADGRGLHLYRLEGTWSEIASAPLPPDYAPGTFGLAQYRGGFVWIYGLAPTGVVDEVDVRSAAKVEAQLFSMDGGLPFLARGLAVTTPVDPPTLPDLFFGLTAVDFNQTSQTVRVSAATGASTVTVAAAPDGNSSAVWPTWISDAPPLLLVPQNRQNLVELLYRDPASGPDTLLAQNAQGSTIRSLKVASQGARRPLVAYTLGRGADPATSAFVPVFPGVELLRVGATP